jgi:8-oxo-dGTP pyrophosphatase MutT (NUDIX family)
VYCPSCGSDLREAPPTVCERCGIAHWRNAKPCAGALVRDGTRVLLVRRARDPWRGRWDIPGGFCHADEHPVHAAAREVSEETGILIRITGFLGAWIDDYGVSTASGQVEHTLNLYYHAIPIGESGPAADPDETLDLRWFDAAALPAEQDIAFPSHIPAVLRAWRRMLIAGATESPLLDVADHRAGDEAD